VQLRVHLRVIGISMPPDSNTNCGALAAFPLVSPTATDFPDRSRRLSNTILLGTKYGVCGTTGNVFAGIPIKTNAGRRSSIPAGRNGWALFRLHYSNAAGVGVTFSISPNNRGIANPNFAQSLYAAGFLSRWPTAVAAPCCQHQCLTWRSAMIPTMERSWERTGNQ